MGDEENQEEIIAEVWDRVVRVLNKLIETHDNYGFGKFKEGMNPRLDVVVKGFAVVDAALKTLTESGLLNPEEYRQATNSRQCIYYTRRLALALDSNDEAEYENMIALLTKQAPV